MISLVTPLYKSDRYLKSYKVVLMDCLEKLNRLNLDYEVIFVPKDPSPAEQVFLNDLKTYHWCRVIDSPNPSLYGSWNSGTLAAQGEAVGFLPMDDIRFPEGIKEAVELIHLGAELVYSPFKVRRYINVLGHNFLVFVKAFHKGVLEFNEKNYPEFLRSMVYTPFFIFTKSLYQKVGPFDEQFKIAGDFDWCVRAAKISKRLKRGKEFSGSFRVDGTGVSSGGKLRHVAENNVVYVRHGQQGKILPVSLDLMKEYDPKSLFFRRKKFELSDNGLMGEKNLADFNSQILTSAI
ncbi:MAG: glycosyltransferase family 2 protein [Patescibacteria group bacterium]